MSHTARARKRRRSNNRWSSEARKAQKNLKRQEKDAAIRAKYGPSGKPAPVTVTVNGEIRCVDQSRLQKKETVYSPKLDALAELAGFESYAAYLRSPEWREVRRQTLVRDGFRCRLCRSKKNLVVHHDRYDDVGTDSLRYLKTICWPCHSHIHGERDAA